MSKYLPLWPDRASTIAGQVDALYIYLVLVSAVMLNTAIRRRAEKAR